MSACEQVAKTVWSIGRASVDDVESALEGVYTRDQIVKALGNARARGLIVTVSRTGSAGRKGVYARPDVVPHRARMMLPVPRPIASVFDLATPAEIVPEWPPVVSGGRVVNCLGAWE